MSAERGRRAARRRVANERGARDAPPPRVRTRARAKTPAASAGEYESVALVLQGGGALGSYQCGVYEALHDA